MSFTESFDNLSREQLFSLLTELKRKNSCLKTDLIKCQLFLKCYEKYFNYFNEMNEKSAENEEILSLIKRLKAYKYLNQNSDECLVSVNKISKKGSNRKLFQILN